MINKEKQPLVSIIIPVFNAEKFLKQTIESIRRQTYSNYEIIAVDDESTDNSLSVLNEIALNEKRLKVFKHKNVGGPQFPRNEGLRQSSGGLIAFLDADDIWVKDKLEAQVRYMNNHPEVGLLYGASVTFGATPFLSPHYSVLPLPFRASCTFDDLVNKGNSIPCSSVILRKDILNITGLFDEDPKISYAEDYDLWMRISKVTKISFMPKILVLYRIHSGQISSGWSERKERLEYLAQKRNLPLRKYSFVRNRGAAGLFIYSVAQVFGYIYYKIYSVFGGK